MENEFIKEFNEEEFREDIKKVKNSPEIRKVAREEGVYIGSAIWHNIIIGILVVSWIIFVIGFLYLVANDHFKSTTDVMLKPLYNQTTNNLYENTFDNDIQNDYKFEPNYTINNYNNVILPDNFCDACP